MKQNDWDIEFAEVEPRYAEDANYWQTTVHPAKSQAGIIEQLEDFGTTNMMIAQGQTSGRMAWLVRFEWQGRSYRFTFTPLPCRNPDKASSFGGKRRIHTKQAEYQMGRVALHFVKAILTAAEAQPHALFGFVELPGVGSYPGGLPVTAGDLDVEGLTDTLPSLDVGAETPFLLSPGSEIARLP